MTRTANIMMAGAAALSATITVFVGLPAIVYRANEATFYWPLANLLLAHWPLAVLAFMVLALPPCLLPVRLGKAWAIGTVVTAVYLWAHGVFQTHDFGSMDGLNFRPTVPPTDSLIEFVVILLLCILIAVFALRMPKAATALVLFPVLGGLAEAVPAIITTPPAPVSNESRIPDIAKLSKTSNVVVVLLDGMQSDVFEEVVRRTPALSSEMKGFTLYANTLGAAPSTFLSMPTVHSGETYDRSALRPYFQSAVGRHSVLTKIVASGSRGILVNPIQNICPDQVKCLTSRAAMTGDSQSISAEATVLTDSVLFRIAPLFLKDAVYTNTVYNKSKWMLWAPDPRFVNVVAEGNAFLREVASATNAGASAPQLRFFHLFSTHPPFLSNEDCTYTGKELEFNRVHIERQVSCALGALSELFSAMKKAGVYDPSHIIIMSDHGIGLKKTGNGPSNSLSHTMALANPTFAVKPAGSTTPFQVDHKDVHIGDFGATLCDLLNSCIAEHGYSALSQPIFRSRLFNQYAMTQEIWFADAIPGLVQYRVVGPQENSGNWFPNAPEAISIGQQIDFTQKGNGGHYLSVGWHQLEPWGTWSGADTTSLLGYIFPDIPDHLYLRLSAIGFVLKEHPKLDVDVYVNNKFIQTLAFDPTNSKQEVTIPLDASTMSTIKSADGLIKISFRNKSIASPASLGISADTRPLGIGLKWIRLEEGPARPV